MSKHINCLVTFDVGIGNYRLVEVCGSTEECKKKGDELRGPGAKYPIAVKFTQDAFVDFMLQERIGKILDVLLRLEKAFPNQPKKRK